MPWVSRFLIRCATASRESFTFLPISLLDCRQLSSSSPNIFWSLVPIFIICCSLYSFYVFWFEFCSIFEGKG